MRLHVAYRITSEEMSTTRPSFHSRRTSLVSALDAAEHADASMIVLADGPLPDDLRALVGRRARIVEIPNGPLGRRRSFLASLRYPDVADWPDEDLVYFCEDDYLHQVNALTELVAAAAQMHSAHYFALYASTPRHPVVGPGAPFHMPTRWQPGPEQRVGQTTWVNVPNTTSTFGARIGSLRQDLGIFRQAAIPYATRYLNYEMFLVLQGRLPYSTSEVLRGHPSARCRTGLEGLVSNSVLAPFRLAYRLRSRTRREDPHLLYAADPNLACHMETEFLAPGVDWSAVAEGSQVQ